MSEQAPEQQTPAAPDPNAPPGGPEQQTATPVPPQTTATTDDVQEFPLRLVKRATGDVHWNTAKGLWEIVTHAETGEPTMEYALLTTVDGVDVTLETFNAGGVETIVRSAQQAQQAQQQSGS